MGTSASVATDAGAGAGAGSAAGAATSGGSTFGAGATATSIGGSVDPVPRVRTGGVPPQAADAANAVATRDETSTFTPAKTPAGRAAFRDAPLRTR